MSAVIINASDSEYHAEQKKINTRSDTEVICHLNVGIVGMGNHLAVVPLYRYVPVSLPVKKRQILFIYIHTAVGIIGIAADTFLFLGQFRGRKSGYALLCFGGRSLLRRMLFIIIGQLGIKYCKKLPHGNIAEGIPVLSFFDGILEPFDFKGLWLVVNRGNNTTGGKGTHKKARQCQKQQPGTKQCL